MLKINIQPKTIEKAKKGRRSGAVIAISIIIILIVLGIDGTMYLYNLGIEAKIKNTQKETESVRSSNGSAIELNDKVKKLNQQISEIKTLASQRIDYPNLLKTIAAKTPKDLQITELSLAIDQSKQNMQITGISASRRSIMEFRSGLEKSGLFKNVDFVSSSLKSDNNYDFQINFNLKNQAK